jgi:hypothetical protein
VYHPERFPKVGSGGVIFQKDLSVGMFYLSSRYFWEKAAGNQARKGGGNGPLLVSGIGHYSHSFPSGSC